MQGAAISGVKVGKGGLDKGGCWHVKHGNMELLSEGSNIGVRNCKFKERVSSVEFGEHCLGDEDIHDGVRG